MSKKAKLILLVSLIVLLCACVFFSFERRIYFDASSGRFSDGFYVISLKIKREVRENEFSAMWTKHFGSYVEPNWILISKFTPFNYRRSPSYALLGVEFAQRQLAQAFEWTEFDHKTQGVIIQNFLKIASGGKPYRVFDYSRSVIDFASKNKGRKISMEDCPKYILSIEEMV